MAIIDKVRTALRVTTTGYDDEITDLIEAAKADLVIAGVVLPCDMDAPTLAAIKTYCKMSFGLVEDYDKLKRSYDEQKAQLVTDTGHTDWLEV